MIFYWFYFLFAKTNKCLHKHQRRMHYLFCNSMLPMEVFNINIFSWIERIKAIQYKNYDQFMFANLNIESNVYGKWERKLCTIQRINTQLSSTKFQLNCKYTDVHWTNNIKRQTTNTKTEHFNSYHRYYVGRLIYYNKVYIYILWWYYWLRSWAHS